MARRKRPHAGQTGEEPVAVTEAQVLDALRVGRVVERGILPYSSNHSFLVTVRHEGLEIPAVYKPQRGESPLWDFEWGTLCKREAAAYTVSHALGWNLVPPTVLREATRGLGSIQFYVPHNANIHYFSVQADARFALSLRRLALFDAVTNNADRKSGHCLIGDDSRLWAIDHGLCFHSEYKLRTVIWEFSEEPIPQPMLDDLADLRNQLVGIAPTHPADPLQDPDPAAEAAGAEAAGDVTEPSMGTPQTVADRLCQLLSPGEQRALLLRLHALLHSGIYPAPIPERRNYPWPPV